MTKINPKMTKIKPQMAKINPQIKHFDFFSGWGK